MPVLKIKNKNGEWKDIASAYTHSHTISDITDLPANLAEDIEALKDKVGAESVAYQVSTAIESAVGYEHPETHPADMITGLSTVATSGSYNDLTDLPEVGDVLPEIAEGDEGKVLGVVENTWQKMDLPKELPVITTEHNGKLLGVVDDAWAIVDAPKNENNYSDKKVVLAETDLEFTSGEHINFEPSFTLVEGEIYTVVWEGTEYPNLTAEIMSVSGHNAIGIGNKAIFEIGDDTGEPFAMGILTGGMFACYTAVAETATYSVAIYKDKPELPDITSEDNGKVLGVVDGEWAIVDAPAGSSGGNGGASVQPDYTQNDETAADYIKNRPFYESDPIQTEVLPATSLPFTYDSSWGAFVYAVTPTTEQLEIWQSDWETATIVWGEETFVCEPQYFNGIKLVGNLPAMLGAGNNNIPFVIGIDNSSGQFLVASIVDTAETNRNVSVSVELIMINTLDPKFLGDVPWDKVSDKPFGDILAGAVAVEETTVTMTSMFGSVGAQGFAVNKLNFIVGATYNITVNGIAYAGECTYDSEDLGAEVIQWSGGMLSPYVPLIGNSIYMSDAATEGDSVTIKVELAEDAVVKIDAKYLPEIETLPEVTTDDSGKTLVVSTEGKWTVGESTGGSGGSSECKLPEVTTADNDKFLQVVDGVWTAVTIELAEGGDF